MVDTKTITQTHRSIHKHIEVYTNTKQPMHITMGARTKTTRSKSPRNTVPVVIENVDEENEDDLEEEGGCWSDVGKGRGNRRGRGQGANSGRGRGGEDGARSRRGKGRDDPHQPSVKEFIPNPRARLAAGGWS